MDRIDLQGLEIGAQRQGAACVRALEERRTRAGQPYLAVTLGNASGEARVMVWSDAMGAWEGVTAGSAVAVELTMQPGRNGRGPEPRCERVRLLGADHPVRAELNPVCPEPRSSVEHRIRVLVDSLERPESHLLATTLLHAAGDAYFEAPAAVGNHHSYLLGHAQHAAETGEAARALAGLPFLAGRVDRDSVVIGALFHDLGKLQEYAWVGEPITMSRAGLMRSHLTLGQEMVREATRELVAEGRISALAVAHVCMVQETHHRELSWGSPTPPRTLEAWLVHLADGTSAWLRPLLDRLESDARSPGFWVPETGWKDAPLFDLLSALVEEGPMEEGPVTSDEPAPPLRVTSNSDDLEYDAERAPHVELPRWLCGYLLHLVQLDLDEWTEKRSTGIDREKVAAFALFLRDWTPSEMLAAMEQWRARRRAA
jgi:3'-5' exoribonuclease